jgi:hypothetical protein
LEWFLAIKFERNIAEGYYDLSQEQYALSTARVLGLENCNPSRTPEIKDTLSASDGAHTPEELEAAANFPYRRLIGMLLFLCVCCRPDLMHALKVVCQFVTNPGPKHIEAVKQLVRYVATYPTGVLRLYGSKDPRVTLGIFCDSDD